MLFKIPDVISIFNIEQFLDRVLDIAGTIWTVMMSMVAPAEHPVLFSGHCASPLGRESSPRLPVVLAGAMNRDIPPLWPQGWFWGPREPVHGPSQDLSSWK